MTGITVDDFNQDEDVAKYISNAFSSSVAAHSNVKELGGFSVTAEIINVENLKLADAHVVKQLLRSEEIGVAKGIVLSYAVELSDFLNPLSTEDQVAMSIATISSVDTRAVLNTLKVSYPDSAAIGKIKEMRMFADKSRTTFNDHRESSDVGQAHKYIEKVRVSPQSANDRMRVTNLNNNTGTELIGRIRVPTVQVC